MRADGGSSNSELLAKLEEMNRDTSQSCLTWDTEHSNLDDHIIILQCNALLEAAAAFANRSDGPLRLCSNATHDIGLQRWKLISVGFLGVHYHHAAWHVTLVPLAYALAISENEAACSALITAVTARLDEQHNLNLRSRVGAIYLD